MKIEELFNLQPEEKLETPIIPFFPYNSSHAELFNLYPEDNLRLAQLNYTPIGPDPAELFGLRQPTATPIPKKIKKEKPTIIKKLPPKKVIPKQVVKPKVETPPVVVATPPEETKQDIKTKQIIEPETSKYIEELKPEAQLKLEVPETGDLLPEENIYEAQPIGEQYINYYLQKQLNPEEKEEEAARLAINEQQKTLQKIKDLIGAESGLDENEQEQNDLIKLTKGLHDLFLNTNYLLQEKTPQQKQLEARERKLQELLGLAKAQSDAVEQGINMFKSSYISNLQHALGLTREDIKNLISERKDLFSEENLKYQLEEKAKQLEEERKLKEKLQEEDRKLREKLKEEEMKFKEKEAEKDRQLKLLLEKEKTKQAEMKPSKAAKAAKAEKSILWDTADRVWGKRIAEYMSQDKSQITKSIMNAEQAMKNLEKELAKTGTLTSIVKDALGLGKIAETRQNAHSAVANTLKPILGSQFTQREGERILNFTFDTKLSSKENIRRLKNLIDSLKAIKKQNDAVIEHARKTGTIRTFKQSIANFDDMTSSEFIQKFIDKNSSSGKILRWGGKQYKLKPGGDPKNKSDWEEIK